jgi:small subunit ribosomal protein S8
MSQDTIADYLTKIRNAIRVKKDSVSVTHSKVKEKITEVLKNSDYISSYETQEKEGFKFINIVLKYKNNKSVINEIKRNSKPARRIYLSSDKIPYIRRGYGMGILSTSKGIMADKDARKNKVGGEFICTIW